MKSIDEKQDNYTSGPSINSFTGASSNNHNKKVEEENDKYFNKKM